MNNYIRYKNTLFAFLLIIGGGSAYAGCTVNGTTVSGAISEANLDTAIGTGTDDITTCDVSSITDMSGLFHSKTSFNQDIGAWDTSNVTTMYQMFHSATSFNKDVSDWNTGSVTTMAQMFHSAVKFNNGGVALDWSDTSSVTTMSQMLHSNSKFNQDVSGWNTGNVTTMYEMFHSSSVFNNGGVALDWSDTSKVTTMYRMFHSNSAFNQSVSTWQTGSVTTMFEMFHSSGFNQSIATWDMSNVTNSTDMFNSAPYLSTAPTLTSSTPADGATAVAVDANIVLNFWKAVDVESGNITIKKSSDDSTVETIDVTGSKVTGTGTHTITINPSSTLSSSTNYYLNIAATAFDDASSNSYAGISDATTLNFTVIGSDPTLKKDVIGSIEAWSDISSRWADSSTMSAHNRIDWLIRNKGSNKTSHQGIELNFEDKTVDSIMNNSPTDALSDIDVTNTAASLIENSDGSAAEVSDNVESEASNIAINEAARLRESLIGSLNPSFGPVTDNWSMWTGGKVVIGNTDASTTASKKKVNFQAISIGFDKPIGNGDELMGFVLSIGQDDTDIGVSTTNVKSNNYSISNYTVFKPSNNTQIESVFGLGLLDFDTIRADDSDTFTGTRDANQLFFSSALRLLNNVNLGNWQVSPYSKVSLAETSLEAFSESGATNTALTFAKQKVKDTSMGVGIDIYSQISTDSSTIKPYAKIEYNQSSSKTSASMHYNIESISLNSYTTSLNKKNKNWKLKFGLDLNTESGWDMSISYMREQSIGSSNDSKSSDNFSFNAGTSF